MRQLATVRRIATLSPIENSDNLEVATLHSLGWQVVVAKDSFQIDQQVVFFEIDSALPVRPEFEFLRARCHRSFDNGKDECFRLRTIKLRGVVSQGLIVPITIMRGKQFPEGTDVTQWLNVRHYDELVEQYRPAQASDAESVGSFPSFVPKTDEDRIQNHLEYFDGRYRDTWFEVTEKADGSSMTVIWSPTHFPDDPFQICSRNFRLRKNPDSKWMKPLVERDLEAKMRENDIEFALQGELVGPGINGNRDKYTEYHFLVFNVWDIQAQRMYDTFARTLLCRMLGVEHVKILNVCEHTFVRNHTLKELLDSAKGDTDRGNPREGLVFKSSDGVSFKVINNDYLLKETL